MKKNPLFDSRNNCSPRSPSSSSSSSSSHGGTTGYFPNGPRSQDTESVRSSNSGTGSNSGTIAKDIFKTEDLGEEVIQEFDDFLRNKLTPTRDIIAAAVSSSRSSLRDSGGRSRTLKTLLLPIASLVFVRLFLFLRF